MGVYLETNALRKLTDYNYDEHVYTSIFSIFELLSGITEDEQEFKLRKTCINRIFKHHLEIRGPMVDKLFMQLLDVNDFNEDTYKMIWDSAKELRKSKNYAEFNKKRLFVTFKDNHSELISPIKWLSKWDKRISNITTDIKKFFEEENDEYIRNLYNTQGEKGLANHFFTKYYDNRLDYTRLSHAEPFVGTEKIEEIKLEADNLFSRYNYKLFITAQAVIFAKAYFIDGGTQDKNNPSDLLHLLYLAENDKLVSDDKIYKRISKGCEYFNHIKLEDNETSLSNLMRKQTSQTSN